MYTDLRKKGKNYFEKYIFKLMSNAVFEKSMGNVRKHRDVKLVTAEARRSYLVSESSYQKIIFFLKIVIYQFWYDYVKAKYAEKAQLCYMDTDIINIKTDDTYKGIAEDVETRFHTSNYKLYKPWSKGKGKKVIGLMKHELDRKIMKEFVGLEQKLIVT